MEFPLLWKITWNHDYLKIQSTYIICGVYRSRFLFLTTQFSMWNIFLFVVIRLLKYPFEKGLTSWLLEVCTRGTVPYHPWSFFSTATVFSHSAVQGYIDLADQDTLMGNIHCRAPYQVDWVFHFHSIYFIFLLPNPDSLSFFSKMLILTIIFHFGHNLSFSLAQPLGDPNCFS